MIRNIRYDGNGSIQLDSIMIGRGGTGTTRCSNSTIGRFLSCNNNNNNNSNNNKNSFSSSTSTQSSFLEPTNIYDLHLNDDDDNGDDDNKKQQQTHRILEWTKTKTTKKKIPNDDDPSASSSSSSYPPYVVFFHANSVGPGPWEPIIRRLLLDSMDDADDDDENTLQTCLAVESRGHGHGQPHTTTATTHSSAGGDTTSRYRWELFAHDFQRIIATLTSNYNGQPPRAIVTHSFSGDCALLSTLAVDEQQQQQQHETTDKEEKVQQQPRSFPLPRWILLDPVLADTHGATIGAEKLAQGTIRLGQREATATAANTTNKNTHTHTNNFGTSSKSVADGYETILIKSGLLAPPNTTLNKESMIAFEKYAVVKECCNSTNTTSYDDNDDDDNDDSDNDTDSNSSSYWRLQCSRKVEAAIYKNRISIGETIINNSKTNTTHVAPSFESVQLVFASHRRCLPQHQDTTFAKDWNEAERVVNFCNNNTENSSNDSSSSDDNTATATNDDIRTNANTSSLTTNNNKSNDSKIHLLTGVGHFLVLENPELVTKTLKELLPFDFSSSS